MVLYPSKLILLLSSYIKLSVKLRGPVPETVIHAHAMTTPPPCFTDETVCFGSIAKKAHQRLYFLHQLRKFNLPQELLKPFYSAIIKTVLCSSITVWFGSASKTDIRRLQRTVGTAERIIGAPLPSFQDLYISRVRKRAKKVTGPLTPCSLSL